MMFIIILKLNEKESQGFFFLTKALKKTFSPSVLDVLSFKKILIFIIVY